MHVKVIKGLSKNFFIPPPPKESYEDFIHRSDTESGQLIVEWSSQLPCQLRTCQIRVILLIGDNIGYRA